MWCISTMGRWMTPSREAVGITKARALCPSVSTQSRPFWSQSAQRGPWTTNTMWRTAPTTRRLWRKRTSTATYRHMLTSISTRMMNSMGSLVHITIRISEMQRGQITHPIRIIWAFFKARSVFSQWQSHWHGKRISSRTWWIGDMRSL